MRRQETSYSEDLGFLLDWPVHIPGTLEFFVGVHQPSDAKQFHRACISINRLRSRKSDFAVNTWMMDSGAFTELSTYGHYRHDVGEYAKLARRWVGCGDLRAIVAQDYMCEPWITGKTGLSVPEHQRLTVERYDALLDEDIPCHIMPVLQGFAADDYVRHLEMYGDRLAHGSWVGVGSVCKRQGRPSVIVDLLKGIKKLRPDLRLHGFGVKKTALMNREIQKLLSTADSMAWSFAARREGRDANSWVEAARFAFDIECLKEEIHL